MKTSNHLLFTAQSNAYRDFRPTYDTSLFAWLAEQAPSAARVWDCGCGSGQASFDLADHFQQVVATDVNEKQLSHAQRKPNIIYRCEAAETSSLDDKSVDLTVVAQALHWFSIEPFYAEVRRVSKPGALLDNYALRQAHFSVGNQHPHANERSGSVVPVTGSVWWYFWWYVSNGDSLDRRQ